MKMQFRQSFHDCSTSSYGSSSWLSMPVAHYVTGISNIMALAALLLVILSVSTDHWTVVTVDRKGLQVLADKNSALNNSMNSDPTYFTRNRGLFRICFSGDLPWIKSYEPKDKVDGKNCLKETGFEVVQSPETVRYGKSYDDRKHLLRAQVGVHICCILFLALTSTFGFIGCYDYSVTILRTTGILAFASSFLMSGSMALFHGYDYLERQKIDAPEFNKAVSVNVPLRDYSKLDYGFSYMLGWLATVICFVTAIFFLVSSHLVLVDRCKATEEEEYRQNFESEKSRVPRNLAYDLIENGYSHDGDMRLFDRHMSMW